MAHRVGVSTREHSVSDNTSDNYFMVALKLLNANKLDKHKPTNLCSLSLSITLFLFFSFSLFLFLSFSLFLFFSFSLFLFFSFSLFLFFSFSLFLFFSFSLYCKNITSKKLMTKWFIVYSSVSNPKTWWLPTGPLL